MTSFRAAWRLRDEWLLGYLITVFLGALGGFCVGGIAAEAHLGTDAVIAREAQHQAVADYLRQRAGTSQEEPTP